MFEYRRVEAPYPGLRPFEPYEVEIFFGRENQTDRLLEILERERFLAVVGPSGCGKSSLVRAGLLPSLASGVLSTGSDWRLAWLRPGAQPLLALAQALLGPHALGRELMGGAASSPQDANEVSAEAALIAAELRRGAPGWLDVLRGAAARRPVEAAPFNLLVLVDQFEEVFTYAGTAGSVAGEAQTFVDLLLAARAGTEFQVFVVLTMRMDFLGECRRFLELPEAINRAQYLPPRLSLGELVQAIVKPAQGFGGNVQKSLVEEIVDDFYKETDGLKEADQLPVLQHALSRLWIKAKELDPDRPIIQGTAAEIGRALDDHAERIFESFTLERQRLLAERLFRAITESCGNGYVRRPQTLAEIAAWTGDTAQDFVPVIQRYAAPGVNFLHYGAALTGNSIIDLTHEALIRQWRRLENWLRDEYQRGEEYRKWSRRAKETGAWADGLSGDTGSVPLQDLWKGGLKELEPAKDIWLESIEGLGPAWARRYSDCQDDNLEREFRWTGQFITQSHEAAQQEFRAREFTELEEESSEQKRKIESLEAEKQKHAATIGQIAAKERSESIWRGNKKLAWTVGVMASIILPVIVVVLALIAVFAWDRTQHDNFDAQTISASLLAGLREYANARGYLQQSHTLDADIPVERRHARNLLAGYVEMMDWRTEQIYQFEGRTLTALAVNRDGKMLAVAGKEGFLALFNTGSGTSRPLIDGQAPTGELRAIALDATGRWLYGGGGGDDDGFIIRAALYGKDKTVVWKVPGGVQSLALSPDGKRLASGGTDGKIELWSLPNGKPMGGLALERGNPKINSLAFSPGGGLLAAAYGDQTARLWDLHSKQIRSILSNAHTDKVTAVAFNSDGGDLATGGSDGQVALWEVDKDGAARFVRSLHGLPGVAVTGVEFGGDGSQLVSGYEDGTLRLWDVESGALRRYESRLGNNQALAIHSQDVYAVGGDTLRHWSLAPSEPPRQWLLKTRPNMDTPYADNEKYDAPQPTAVAIAPGGDKLAMGSKEGSLQIYRLPDGLLLAEELRAHGESPIARLEFNAKGDRLASLSKDKAILWNIPVGGDGKLQKQKEINATAVAFSPNGRTLAKVDAVGGICLLDLDTDRQRWCSQSQEAKPVSLAFTPDGKRLLSLGDGRLLLWNIADPGQSSLREIAQTQKRPTWVTINPDGRQVAVVGEDQSVELYDLDRPEQPPIRLEGHKKWVSRAIYSPDGHQLATVGDDKTVRLWNLDRREPLFILRVPEAPENSGPSDFDFHCTIATGECWIAVPLTSTRRVALYRLPYERMPDGG
ncbi:WD40 repeat domain-containing protein [Methylomagnum ishizawai]|uniref:WD40 repeat domain-containing protein n=1 Tax=Methylomagnum ishizawai TaxID=1760988 RepID=UPI001C31FBCC|nr:hypothetical protein [Methylomagnum ishizawai]BBL73069.1 hypothetical protein MishRS11D_01670 [Methylomagnum ishizawai]